MDFFKKCLSLIKSTSICSFLLIILTLVSSSKFIHSLPSVSSSSSSLLSMSPSSSSSSSHSSSSSSAGYTSSSSSSSSSSFSGSPSKETYRYTHEHQQLPHLNHLPYTSSANSPMVNDAPDLSSNVNSLNSNPYGQGVEIITHTGSSSTGTASLRHHDLHNYSNRPPKQTWVVNSISPASHLMQVIAVHWVMCVSVCECSLPLCPVHPLPFRPAKCTTCTFVIFFLASSPSIW